MKIWNHNNSRPSRLLNTISVVAVALAGIAGFTMNAQAQTCTVENWSTEVNLDNDDAGQQGAAFGDSNRRYAGPCGLRVPVDGTERFLTDASPNDESTYIVRFYVYLDDAGSDAILLYSADSGTEDEIQVWYNAPDVGDLTLRIFDSNDDSFDITGPAQSGWNSVQFVWEAASSAEIRFAVNTHDEADDEVITVDTSGIEIQNAHLGTLTDVNTGGSVDFDDFDSRRQNRPGRLCRGLTNDARDALDLEDAVVIFEEFASGGGTPANGQPDFNEDGSVDLTDAVEVFERFASGQEACDLNR